MAFTGGSSLIGQGQKLTPVPNGPGSTWTLGISALPPIFRSLVLMPYCTTANADLNLTALIPNTPPVVGSTTLKSFDFRLTDTNQGPPTHNADRPPIVIPLEPLGQSSMGFEVIFGSYGGAGAPACLPEAWVSTEPVEKEQIPFPFYLGHEVPSGATAMIEGTYGNNSQILAANPNFGAWWIFGFDAGSVATPSSVGLAYAGSMGAFFGIVDVPATGHLYPSPPMKVRIANQVRNLDFFVNQGATLIVRYSFGP